MIEVKNVSFQYDKHSHAQTLTDISFQVTQGEWLAITGHNGSGKSTIAKMLVGLITPDEGTVRIAGIEMNEQTMQKIRQHIGIVFQNPDNQFVASTVQDDVAFALENQQLPFAKMKTAVDLALDQTGLTALREHDPARLSGGQKQRAALAGILALKPAVIVLDEALVMLDPKSKQEMLAIVKELNERENITIVLITHDMNEAVMADRMIVLTNGKLTHEGKPSELFSEQLGLAAPLPFAEKLRRALQKRGLDVPRKYMSNEDLVNWYAHYVKQSNR